MLSRSDIVHGRISACDFGVLLKGFEDLFADLKVIVIAGGFVKEVSRFDELGTQVILTPVNLKLCN